MTKVRRTRSRWFVYLPLMVHIIPALIIGFGFVIPWNCVAGVNAQTIGFAITIAGFIAAYTAGVRIAGRPGVQRNA
jgi:ABC-type Fe3+ transport system permease subunit